MKTELTYMAETAVINHCIEVGQFPIHEVTMPNKHGIVDVLSYQLETKHMGRGRPIQRTPLWRCYEIKVSKADFYSKAKKTFVGHLNYYVMPPSLYELVKQDIPSEIGVYLVYSDKTLVSEKKAKRIEPKVSEAEFYRQFIGSLNREVLKARVVLENYKNKRLQNK